MTVHRSVWISPLVCAALSACASVGAPHSPAGRLAETSWTIASVSGDPLSRPGSTIHFTDSQFEAKLPCSIVTGSFTEQGDALRVTDVQQKSRVCQPLGQERYFGGKMGQGGLLVFDPLGVTIQTPPDYIRLVRAE